MMPTLSSLVAPAVGVIITPGTNSNDKVGITITIFDFEIPHWIPTEPFGLASLVKRTTGPPFTNMDYI